MKKWITLIAIAIASSVSFANAQSQPRSAAQSQPQPATQLQTQSTTPTLREGTHNLTLQWISWDVPGKVKITRQTDGTYTVKGEQRNKAGDFVTIDGTLKVLDPKQLLFTGNIQSRYTGVNNGNPCDKQGTFHFLSKGARQYWRLQEMDNCEGNNVVDYVDIYFK
jgi:hypothetical protein